MDVRTKDSIIVIESDLRAPDALERVLDRLEQECATGEPFALAIAARGGMPQHRQQRGSGRVKQLLRLKAVRPHVSVHCAGIAFVLDADDPQLAKRLRGAPKAFGCEVLAFDELDDATAWLLDCLDRHTAPA